DGMRIDPQVSDPQPIAPKLAATPAPVPPLEPPGIRVGSYGLQVCPASEPVVVMPLASSCRFVLPRMIAPASRNFLTWNASRDGMKPARASDPAVVGMSLVP